MCLSTARLTSCVVRWVCEYSASVNVFKQGHGTTTTNNKQQTTNHKPQTTSNTQHTTQHTGAQAHAHTRTGPESNGGTRQCLQEPSLPKPSRSRFSFSWVGKMDLRARPLVSRCSHLDITFGQSLVWCLFRKRGTGTLARFSFWQFLFRCLDVAGEAQEIGFSGRRLVDIISPRVRQARRLRSTGKFDVAGSPGH